MGTRVSENARRLSSSRNMNCPYCHTIMQEGFIDNVKVPVYWKEKGFKNSLLPYRKKKQGVRIMLGTGDNWYGGSVSAFLCYKCSIVLITDIAKKNIALVLPVFKLGMSFLCVRAVKSTK